jgi:hypothetical protein
MGRAHSGEGASCNLHFRSFSVPIWRGLSIPWEEGHLLNPHNIAELFQPGAV